MAGRAAAGQQRRDLHAVAERRTHAGRRPDRRGGWHNLSLSTSRDDLVRSVFEGVAFNSRWLLGTVERFTGRRSSDPFIGGGPHSDLWCQIMADVLDRTIDQVEDPMRADARGAGRSPRSCWTSERSTRYRTA